MKKVLIDILRWLLVLPASGVCLYLAIHILKGFGRWISNTGDGVMQGLIAYLFISLLLGASFGVPGVSVAPKKHRVAAGIMVVAVYLCLCVVMCVEKRIIKGSMALNITTSTLSAIGCVAGVVYTIRR